MHRDLMPGNQPDFRDLEQSADRDRRNLTLAGIALTGGALVSVIEVAQGNIAAAVVFAAIDTLTVIGLSTSAHRREQNRLS